jgi:NADH-quinone oxidoreductase subunit G
MTQIHKLVPSAKVRADIQSPAHSPARRTVTPSGSLQQSRAKISPFDPFAIPRPASVPGDNLLRLQLLSGNDQHLQPAAPAPLVQIGSRRDLVLPANDSLFTSGTLGRYSTMLSDLQHNESLRPPTGLTQIETAAD